MDNYGIKIDCILSHCPLHGKQVVPPWGNELSKIVLIGDSPGLEEERRNRPFVGKTGKILQDAAKSAGISWDSLFMTNAVKCRIDKTGTIASEISKAKECCSGYLEYAILSVRPDVIIACGSLALSQVMRVPVEPMKSQTWVWSDLFHCKVLPIIQIEDKLADPEIGQEITALFKIALSMIKIDHKRKLG